MTYNKRPNPGQTTMSASEPVVIASDQSAIPVSATDLDIRNLTNTDVVTAELSATDNAVLDTIAASVAAIDTDTTTIISHIDGIETLLTSLVSTNNSSTATLSGGAGFTGTSDDIKDYGMITVTVFTDQASATDGLSLQQSSNGTNWDLVDTYTISASAAKTISLPRQARYFRIVYTNGATPNTVFRLQTIFTPVGGKSSSQRPSDAYSNEFDGEQSVSYGMTFNGTTWDRAKGDIDVAVTGQGSQTALNQNVINAVAGTGSYNTLDGVTGISFRSVSLQITPAAGTVTAGVITFEGSNDNTNFVQVFLSDNANVTAIPVATVTLAASTTRYFVGAIPFRYFRARISTGITGTTTGVQAFTVFSTVPFSSPRLTVSQATGASLSANISAIVSGTGATNLGKARDAAIGATDTGVAVLGVRRDTPTAETPVAGDYIVPQYSANGEAWVRTQGELADDAAFTVGTTRVQPVGYMADSTSTDSVDEGDIGAARMTLDRRQIVQPYEDLTNSVSGAITTAMTGTTSTSLVAAPGAGLRNYITQITVSNSHATVGTDVIIQDGSGGTTLYTIPAAALYGGAAITFPHPLRQTTANTALFCANVTTGASTKVSASGFKAV